MHFLCFTESEVDQFIADGKLLFSKFDIEKVLQNGASLLGSEGGQFNEDEKLAGNLFFFSFLHCKLLVVLF